ncbi:hypothetical protein DQ04_10241010 [Trypanosoma grayi]|uniref:hypothetical protein n=1 Tax=Trypanosoma grayi TaxID=71804 RepID=UPI0004F4A92F|nr:hypothetical protein DQ04_10241010 [Trypanosoma grayi]KEG07304.1 hypothetical protein DQ04_10241010 [Trypanosoma grayi]
MPTRVRSKRVHLSLECVGGVVQKNKKVNVYETDERGTESVLSTPSALPLTSFIPSRCPFAGLFHLVKCRLQHYFPTWHSLIKLVFLARAETGQWERHLAPAHLSACCLSSLRA